VIREAVPEDIPRLLEYGARFADRAKLSEHVGYDAADMDRTFRLMIDAPEHVVFVSDAGAIGGMSGPHPFNYKHIIAQEVFWWSEGRDGLRLFHAFREWAQDKAHSLRMITLEAVEPERTGRLYERLGYAPLEHSYVKVFA
jgi:hypothetical protein